MPTCLLLSTDPLPTDPLPTDRLRTAYRQTGSPPRMLHWRRFGAATGMALLASSLSFVAQGAAADARAGAATVLSDSEAIWRAASRLGYWPSNELAQAMRRHPDGPRGWALDEIDRAFAASRQAANVPPALSTLVQPLPEVFSEFRRERQARLQFQAAVPAAVPAPGAGPARPSPGLPDSAAVSMTASPTAPEGMAAMTTGRAADPMTATAQARDAAVQAPVPGRTHAQHAAAWRMMSCSDPSIENPLLARLTEFWFNHLNVFAGRMTVRPFAGQYAVHAIRPNVLGRFETLLLASAKHPAMLFYLDQNQNVADGTRALNGNLRGLNENYARELMELHTLGVDGGYTQRDVRELARVLTGWTIDPNGDSGFRFVARWHDSAEKTVLGRRFGGAGDASGEQQGLDAIAMLASHPATARRIATRLASFFVADTPPPSLVARLADEFRASQGDLRRMMRVLVAAPEFWDPANELFKTPYDFACSALGASAEAGAGSTGSASGVATRPRVTLALGFLAGAGQPVNGWQTPDGYRTDAATWLSPEALTRRADLAAALASGAADPAHLTAFFAAPTRERISRVAPPSRAALAMASPDFMRK